GSDSVASLGDSHCARRGTLDSQDSDTRAGCTLPFSLACSCFTSSPLIVSPPYRVTTQNCSLWALSGPESNEQRIIVCNQGYASPLDESFGPLRTVAVCG